MVYQYNHGFNRSIHVLPTLWEKFEKYISQKMIEHFLMQITLYKMSTKSLNINFSHREDLKSTRLSLKTTDLATLPI